VPLDAPARSPLDVLAEPRRRAVLDLLRVRSRLVGELAEALGLTQPATSKHLRVLREAGLVEVEVDGPRRRYHLQPAPLATVDAWLEPYRWMWADRLDALGTHLDTMEDES
jgi:DNA-binding transcriptional ArsR family regulator